MSYSEDLFPSADKWNDQSENTYKQWPTTVNPSEVTVSQNRITFANYSHNGRKFTRRSSQAKWQLEVSYPPVNHAEFTAMHAIVLAAQGQYNPFTFDVDYLWHYNDGAPSSMAANGFSSSGNRGINSNSGHAPSQTPAIKKGEVIQYPGGQNGGINIVIGDVDSTIYGTAQVPVSYPVDVAGDLSSITIPRKVQQVVVTLAENGFEYQLLENNFYTVSVIFDLDQWK